MSKSSENNRDHIEKIILEIGLTPDNVLDYEECEIIVDLMDDEVINEVEEEEFRNILRRMRVLHLEVRKMNINEYIRAAKEIFQRIPNKEYVLKYHEAEQISKMFTDEDLAQIEREHLRDTIQSLRHVHDNLAEKKANVIQRMNLY
jgi:hypothetical protein